MKYYVIETPVRAKTFADKAEAEQYYNASNCATWHEYTVRSAAKIAAVLARIAEERAIEQYCDPV